MLYEALAGEVPFPRETEPAKMWAHAREAVPSVRERAPAVSPELDAVVQRAMAKDPGDRYLSAEEMRQAMLDAAGDTRAARADAEATELRSAETPPAEARSAQAGPTVATPLPVRLRRRAPLLAAFLLAIAAALVVVL